MQLVSTAIFLGSVQLAPGPLGYMYMQEVSNYKGVAVGSANMWFILIIIGLITGPMFDSPVLGNYVFFIFGGINLVATLVIYFCLKETKGLSEAEV